jgi:hypothetical protein
LGCSKSSIARKGYTRWRGLGDASTIIASLAGPGDAVRFCAIARLGGSWASVSTMHRSEGTKISVLAAVLALQQSPARGQEPRIGAQPRVGAVQMRMMQHRAGCSGWVGTIDRRCNGRLARERIRYYIRKRCFLGLCQIVSTGECAGSEVLALPWPCESAVRAESTKNVSTDGDSTQNVLGLDKLQLQTIDEVISSTPGPSASRAPLGNRINLLPLLRTDNQLDRTPIRYGNHLSVPLLR